MIRVENGFSSSLSFCRCVYFNPDGSCLYSGVKDFLKVYSWEQALCCDSVPLAWGDVADITSAQSQLVSKICCYSTRALDKQG